jgi:asparagine synthase (glutamine-hydrolysing)
MCGIFGSTDITDSDLHRHRLALATLEHRGPDQWGEWFDDHVYLGHRRLSIIDLSEHGRQPMYDPETGVVIAVNGEIYNYRQLRTDLTGLGRHFKSSSDSEVVLQGFSEWGLTRLLSKLEGMYAITIYDSHSRRIYLVRDRPGIKPLYYALVGSHLVWGSELKALQSFLQNDLAIDPSALYDFLSYLYIPTPKTLYKRCYKLPPGSYLDFDVLTGNAQLHAYWRLEPDSRPISIPQAAETLRGLINKAVKEQLVSDVPLGFFLSGGLDSSTVVAEASKLATHVNTYSIGFGDKKHDENHYARLVAGHFRTNHTDRFLTCPETSDMLYQIKTWYDEPFADTSAFPTFLVSTVAREQSTVVLTGDGGDEIFGGYAWYYDYLRCLKNRQLMPFLRPSRSLFRRMRYLLGDTLPGRACNRLYKATLNDLELHIVLRGGLLRREKESYRTFFGLPADYDDYWYFRQFWRDDLPLLTRMQYLDFNTYLHDDILTKVDRASMAVALECRVPLLSTDLVVFLFSLPEDIRYLNGKLKGLLKYAYAGILPQEILERGKRGFNIPWLRTILRKHETAQERILELFCSVS